MKEKVSVTQYLTGIEEVFNPGVTYEGNYGFNSDVLSLVAKYKNGKNLVDEYFEKRYFKPIRMTLSKINFTSNPRLFLVSDLAGNYGRDLKVWITTFITDLCNNLTNDCPDLSLDVLEMKEQVRTYLKNFRQNITLIQNEDFSSSEVREFNEKFSNVYKCNEDRRKQYMGSSYKRLSYEEFLEKTKECITNLLVNLKYLIPIFDEAIDLKELESCLDLDKFYLAMAKTLIEVSKIVIETEDKIHYSFSFVEKYIKVIENIREESKYKLEIETLLLDGARIRYSVDDAIKEYNEIKFAHPEFKTYALEEDGIDYRDLSLATEMTAYLEECIESKQLAASWNFIKNGKRDENVSQEVVDRLSEKKKNKKTKLSREEKIQAINDRMNFLDHTKYLYKITGKDNFEGYVGYIYDNGSVIFEKFYKSVDNYEPADSNATYVMNFNNFVEMSKKNKTEIMKFIKDGGTGVRRLYHTSNWWVRVLKVVLSKEYDVEAMKKIDTLINDGEVVKKKNNR